MSRSHLLSALLVCSLFCLLPTPASAQAGSPWTNVAKGSPERGEVEAEKEKVATRLGALPAEPAAGSHEDRLKRALERRRSLLEELVGVIERGEELNGDLLESRSQSKELQRKAEAFDAAGKPELIEPEEVTLSGLRSKEQADDKIREKLDGILAEQSEAAVRAADASGARSKLEARISAAEDRQKVLEAELKSADDATAKAAVLELSNARLNESTAKRMIEVIDAERDAASELDTFRALASETYKRESDRLQLELTQYRAALKSQESFKRKQLEEELAAKYAEAEGATDAGAKAVAVWEAKVLRARKEISELQEFAVVLSKEVDEQERRIAEDRSLLERLRQYLDQYGSSGQVAELVRTTIRQLPLKRKALDIAIKPSVAEKLARFRDLRFEIDNTLYDLTDIWRADMQAVSKSLSEDQASRVRSRTGNSRDELLGQLNAEKRALSEVIAQGQRLEALKLDRAVAIDELETFIRARVLWIRDRDPIGPNTARSVSKEVQEAGAWAVRAGAPDTIAKVYRDLTSPARFLYLAGVFFIAPLLFFFAYRGLTIYARGQQAKDTPHNRSLLRLAARVFVDLLRIIVFPAYVGFTAAVISGLSLPEGIELIASSGLRALAVLVFGRSLNRVLFRPDGLFVQGIGMHAEVAAAVHRNIRVVLIAFAALMIPRWILVSEPFLFLALPRVLLTVFLFVVAFAAFRIFRPSSVVMTRGVRGVTLRVITRWRGLWRVLFPVLILASPVLYVMGYGFAGGYAARAVGLSLIAAAVLPPMYRRLLEVVGHYQARRQAQLKREAEAEAARTGDPPEAVPNMEFTAIARSLFVVASIYVFALIWGIDEQAWQALDSMQLWQAAPGADGPEYVTAAGLVFAVLLIVATGWLLRNLPGIFDLTVFPRVNWDTGLRYAMVTMTRYTLVFVSAWWLTSTLKLDTAKLGWLIAAMGVGLGFGLQEIVSNFVSGIILLIERPIRVGDQVTVGNVVGRIQRINIRATTVLNFDRQEVLVPNRSLITQEVINWTLADNVTRLVIKIGVEYGSDLDQVKKILSKIATDQPEVLKDPAPSVVFVNHGESSLDFEVRLFLSDVSQRVAVQDRVNSLINRELAANDIGIPFPQRDLHVVTWPEAGQAEKDASSGRESGDAENKPGPSGEKG